MPTSRERSASTFISSSLADSAETVDDAAALAFAALSQLTYVSADDLKTHLLDVVRQSAFHAAGYTIDASEVADFLKLHKRPVATFDAFVGLYNMLIDWATDRAERSVSSPFPRASAARTSVSFGDGAESERDSSAPAMNGGRRNSQLSRKSAYEKRVSISVDDGDGSASSMSERSARDSSASPGLGMRTSKRDSPYARGRTNSFMIVTSERGTVPEVDLDDEASAIVDDEASRLSSAAGERKSRVGRRPTLGLEVHSPGNNPSPDVIRKAEALKTTSARYDYAADAAAPVLARERSKSMLRASGALDGLDTLVSPRSDAPDSPAGRESAPPMARPSAGVLTVGGLPTPAPSAPSPLGPDGGAVRLTKSDHPGAAGALSVDVPGDDALRLTKSEGSAGEAGKAKKHFRKRRLSKDYVDVKEGAPAGMTEAQVRELLEEANKVGEERAEAWEKEAARVKAEEEAAAAKAAEEAAARAAEAEAKAAAAAAAAEAEAEEEVSTGAPDDPKPLRVSFGEGVSDSSGPPSLYSTGRSYRSELSEALHARRSITFASEMEDTDDDIATFSHDVVGTYSCHGQEPGPDGGVGKINQDCACLAHPFANMRGTGLFCVYDGHGKLGHDVSQEVLHFVYQELEENSDELLLDPGNTLANTFMRCNEHLVKMLGEDPIEVDARDSGTCAVVCFVQGRELWVAGVGDCRAVVGSQAADGTLLAVALTTDHKADLPAEQARIESMGGYVRPTFEDDGEFMPARVYEFQGRPWLGPGLCVARALGDLEGVRCGIIPTPEVCTHTVQEEDLFLILASDGVWEFIENEEAVRIVRLFHEQGKPALDACRFLIAKAALLWRTNEGQYRDDITAIVVYLRPVVQGLEAEVSTGRERTTSVAGSARGQVAAMAPLAEEAEVA